MNYKNLLTTTLIAVASFSLPVMADNDENTPATSYTVVSESTTLNLMRDASMRNSFIPSNDSTINIGLSGITRWRVNVDSNANNTEDEFDLPLARVKLSSSVDGFDFVVSGEWRNGNRTFDLVDAFVSHEYGGFEVTAGQFLPDFFAYSTDSELDLITGQYSVISNTFGVGRSQGIRVAREFGDTSFAVSYVDEQDRSVPGRFTDSRFIVSGSYDLNENVTFNGAWSHLDAYDSFSLGVRGTFLDQFDIELATVFSDNNGNLGDNYGFVGTVSFDVSDRLSPFAQYEYGISDASVTDLSIFTGGVNYTLSDNVRLTASVGYSTEAIATGWDLRDSGWLTSVDSGQVVATVQLGFVF